MRGRTSPSTSRRRPTGGSPLPSTPTSPPRSTRASVDRFGRPRGPSARAAPSPSWPICRRSFPGTGIRRHRRPRPPLQRARPQRVPAHPHGQGRDICGGGTAQVACPTMAWDFSTEPEFQEQLDWMDAFVRDEVEPLDLLWGGTDLPSPRRQPAGRRRPAQAAGARPGPVGLPPRAPSSAARATARSSWR